MLKMKQQQHWRQKPPRRIWGQPILVMVLISRHSQHETAVYDNIEGLEFSMSIQGFSLYHSQEIWDECGHLELLDDDLILPPTNCRLHHRPDKAVVGSERISYHTIPCYYHILHYYCSAKYANNRSRSPGWHLYPVAASVWFRATRAHTPGSSVYA